MKGSIINLTFVSLMLSTWMCAQPAPKGCATNAGAESEFGSAIIRHAREYQDLLDRKTLSRSQLAFDTRGVTISVLRNHVEKSFGDSAAVLFYNYDTSSNRFQIWLITATGPAQYVCSDILHAQIVTAVNDLRFGMEIDQIQAAADRVPRRRGAQGVATQPKVDLEEATRKITDILIPMSIRERLGQVKKLIIVPVLEVGTVPFAALKPYGPDEYLIDRSSISIAPNIFDIDRPSEGRPWTANFKNPLIVANPTLPETGEWIFRPLPGAECEARQVAKILGQSSILSGNTATKRAVMSRVEGADLLYFATHGVADAFDSRENSFLVFGPDQYDDGFWRMREILERRYTASLVVLSACQTGLGESYQGGIMALGRTFQIRGVPRSVMSLWSVDDKATEELMVNFATALMENKVLPVDALRLAMIKTRKNRPKTNQWASFVYFGMPN